MKTQFKEKTYEKYVSQEIGRLTNTSFSPDQCDEGDLGFDDAFFLAGPLVFLLAPYVRRRRRAHLTGLTIADLDLLADEALSRMPPFKFNLFVQYKRPEYMLSKGAAEWASWGEAYYRFEITDHQQAILEQIDQASHGRAATVYAAPAFWKSDDIWQHAEAGVVIDHSAFADVKRLTGHKRYSYIAAGHIGVGHSEPFGIRSVPLRESVSVGLAQNNAIDARQHTIKTARILREVVGRSDEAAALLRRTQAILESGQPSDTELGKALDTLIAFSDAFEVSLRMLG